MQARVGVFPILGTCMVYFFVRGYDMSMDGHALAFEEERRKKERESSVEPLVEQSINGSTTLEHELFIALIKRLLETGKFEVFTSLSSGDCNRSALLLKLIKEAINTLKLE